MKTFLANSKKQDLVEHSFLVAKVAESLFKNYFSEEKYDHFLEIINEDENKQLEFKNIIHILKMSALFHDVGKVDLKFQNYLKNKTSEDIDNHDVQNETMDFSRSLLHHEISYAILSCIKEIQLMKSFSKNAFLYNVLYHHATVLRENKFETVFDLLSTDLNVDELLEDLMIYSDQLNSLLTEKGEKDLVLSLSSIVDEDEKEEIIERSKNTKIVEFQSSQFLHAKNETTEFFKNALFYLLRSVLISADRLVSSLDCEQVKNIIKNNEYDLFVEQLNKSDIAIEKDFDQITGLFEQSERTAMQSEIAKKAAKSKSPAVLRGAAGVGKTKIMLEYLKEINNGKRAFIIVPRQVIAESLFNELSDFYLKNNVKVQILTGENKKTSLNTIRSEDHNLFSGDIVISTIDQILNMMVSHKNIDLLLEVLTSNLLFDEFHEFLEQPAILMLFIQIVYLKNLTRNEACLFVSATPNHFLVKEKMKVLDKNIFSIKSFNNANYKIDLCEFFDDRSAKNIKNKMFENQQTGNICIFNTATKAQVSAVKAQDSGETKTVVYHSKYFAHEKEKIAEQVMLNFGQKEAKKEIVLRSGPIIQASLDISCEKMLTEISSIDNIYQRLGRLVRWNEKEEGEYTILCPVNSGSVFQSLERLNMRNSTEKFITYLKENKEDIKNIKLNEFYHLYDLFFKDREVIKAFELDFKSIKEKAAIVFKNGIEPVKFIQKKKTKNKQKLAKNLRSDNDIFCIVHDLIINSGNETIEDISTDLKNNMFTMSRDLFYGFENASQYAEESRDQIVKYSKEQEMLAVVEENIKSYSYNARKKLKAVSANLMLSLAKNEDTPLFLSFKNKTKKIEEAEQYFNVKFNDLNIGIIKKSHICFD